MKFRPAGEGGADKKSNVLSSKRIFLKGAIAFLGVNMTGIAGPKVYEKVQNTLQGEELHRRVIELEARLSSQYGIEIDARGATVDSNMPGRPLGGIIASDLSEKSLYRAFKGLESLGKALACYPPSFLRKYFRRIALSGDIRPSVNADDDLEYFAVTTRGGEMLMKADDSFFASHRAMFGSLLVPEFVHHEFAHQICSGIRKSDWLALHPGAHYNGEAWKELRAVPAGFADQYGTMDYIEDIGTVAEILFSDSTRVIQRASSDPILAKKVQFLKNWYEEQSNGLLNDEYWQALERGQVSESYWGNS